MFLHFQEAFAPWLVWVHLCFPRRSAVSCFENRQLKILVFYKAAMPLLLFPGTREGEWALAFLLNVMLWKREASGVLTLEMLTLPDKLEKGRWIDAGVLSILFRIMRCKKVRRKNISRSVLSTDHQKYSCHRWSWEEQYITCLQRWHSWKMSVLYKLVKMNFLCLGVFI